MARHVAVGWAFWLSGAVGACGGGSTLPGGGAGGAAASSTTTSSTASTGAGAGGGVPTATIPSGCDPSACWPACFLALTGVCPITGACTQHSTKLNGSFTSDLCYSDGVKVETVVGGASTKATFYKPDGSVCFTSTSTLSGSTITATFDDASGATAFTVTSSAKDSAAQTITCGGASHVVHLDSPACQACQGSGGTQCKEGACAVP
jgi:hypothetical protein